MNNDSIGSTCGDANEDFREVQGGLLRLALELDGGAEAAWREENGGSHLGEAQPVHIIEVVIEIERQIFAGGI